MPDATTSAAAPALADLCGDLLAFALQLKRSKDHLKGSLMLSLESTSSRMNRLAKHEMHLGSFLTMDQMLASIDGVKHEEVQALVTQVIDEAQLALTTLGPLDRRNLPAELRN